MKNIATYEGFFSNILGKKDSKTDSKSKKSFGVSSLFSKEYDDYAKGIYDSLKGIFEPESDDKDMKSKEEKNTGSLIGNIVKYADYKRFVKIKDKDGKEKNISIQKTSSKRRTTTKLFGGAEANYVLVVNNKHYIDSKTGKGLVSQKICRDIWELLDREYKSKYFNQ